MKKGPRSAGNGSRKSPADVFITTGIVSAVQCISFWLLIYLSSNLLLLRLLHVSFVSILNKHIYSLVCWFKYLVPVDLWTVFIAPPAERYMWRAQWTAQQPGSVLCCYCCSCCWTVSRCCSDIEWRHWQTSVCVSNCVCVFLNGRLDFVLQRSDAEAISSRI